VIDYTPTCALVGSDSGVQKTGHDEPPNVGVSRAAGSRRERASWRQEMALQSRAEVTGCASSVGLHALLGGDGIGVYTFIVSQDIQ
jgi:hypothetical protein